MHGEQNMYYFKRFIKKTLRYLLKPLSFIPAIAMTYIIFVLSAQDSAQSGHLSLEVSRYIVLLYNKLFVKGFSPERLQELVVYIHPYVRKGAHFTEYMLLAMSVSLPLYVYRIRGFGLTLIAGGLSLLYAVLDEYHQSFVAGRVADVHDIMIDGAGILVGVIIIRIICYIGRKTIFSWLVLDK